MDTKFTDLGLNEGLIDGIKKLGFEQPSPIQAQTIPVALEGNDIIGLSQTGSGKTAAFGLPLLQSLNLQDKAVQAIVICPTRELAMQVCDEIQRLASCLKGFYAVSVYGGAPIDRQIKALKKGVQLVVGTPGRLLDHIKRRTLKLGGVQLCVLDEADRMLDMGFREEMESILDNLPSERQTMFYSATMNKKVNGLIKAFSNNPQTIEVEKKSLTVDSIEQTYYEVRSRSKIEVLSRLLDMETEPKGIVFCNTKQMVEEASEVLSLRGYLADKIHGDITQSNRERVMKRFREGKVEILVATDVAARGLDIEEVGIVFNYDLPYDPEDYVHRIGRTGRAGKSGKSITFIYGRDIHNLEAIERYTNQPIKRMKIPSQEEVEGKKADSVLNKVRDKLESKDFANYEHYFDRLLDVGHTASDISSVLFDLLGNQENREMQTITEDSEPYSAERKRFSSRDSSFKSRRNGRRRGRRFESKNSDDRDPIHVPHKHKRKRKSSKVRKDIGKPNRSKRSKAN